MSLTNSILLSLCLGFVSVVPAYVYLLVVGFITLLGALFFLLVLVVDLSLVRGASEHESIRFKIGEMVVTGLIFDIGKSLHVERRRKLHFAYISIPSSF